MSYTRTETISIENTEDSAPKLTLHKLFYTRTKPGTPWPTPPDHTSTDTDDADKGCCFPFRKK